MTHLKAGKLNIPQSRIIDFVRDVWARAIELTEEERRRAALEAPRSSFGNTEDVHEKHFELYVALDTENNFIIDESDGFSYVESMREDLYTKEELEAECAKAADAARRHLLDEFAAMQANMSLEDYLAYIDDPEVSRYEQERDEEALEMNKNISYDEDAKLAKIRNKINKHLSNAI